ncbi:DUF3549 family protein [Lacimicrobium alkaliphilum]|uniref:DUF3549 domain-containing protein n=1 Tax=Lacimicrobium alkaliphilum TaxID=1526571 RepID=A0ABQ1RDH7_9ALTE|nr:DUF3549 family protein [Lacimicrobium alkaliphilum]GGD66881.1 hypothetical protein GCM10011357_22630 [Lacimicrobium alkaliphilum]
MSNISTISEFLLHANSQYQVFDMSRGIEALSAQQFLDIENGRLPYPAPRLGAAWLGVLFWQAVPGQHAIADNSDPEYFIWFLKFPLDEQSKLIAGPRDHFLRILLDALARQAKGEPLQEPPDHPYSFVPPQQQMAAFNSLVKKHLGMPPSPHFEKALAYIRAPQDMEWSELPLQGISDVAAAMDDANVEQAVLNGFMLLAEEVRHPLCEAMENQQPSSAFSHKVMEWIATTHQPEVQISGMRALSRSKENQRVSELIIQVLGQSTLNTNLLVTISGRHWHRLTEKTLFMTYMETLAKQAPELFSAIFADLVRIPLLREQMLGLLRSPDKSQLLLKAIGALFSEQGR